MTHTESITGLNARITWAKSIVCNTIGATTEAHDLRDAAIYEAANAGFIAVELAHRYDRMPALLSGIPELEHSYLMGCEEALEMLEEQQKGRDEQIEKTRCVTLIQANDWQALGLPSPDDLAKRLISGETVRVDSHTLSYDSLNDTLWLTNRYGIDCPLIQTCTTAACRSILTKIAFGYTYGPAPH